MRNKCTNLVRESKATFWKKELQNPNTSKFFWKTVRKIQGKTKSAKIGPLADNNDIVLDDTKKANLMNVFFFTVGANQATSLHQMSSLLATSIELHHLCRKSTLITPNLQNRSNL